MSKNTPETGYIFVEITLQVVVGSQGGRLLSKRTTAPKPTKAIEADHRLRRVLESEANHLPKRIVS